MAEPCCHTPVLSLKDGRPVVTSLRVAEHFGKRHDNVLRAIRNLGCSPEFNALNFEAVEYLDEKGESRTMVEMTRDGFMIICMGFTGPEAVALKEGYISAFNAMEAELQARVSPSPCPAPPGASLTGPEVKPLALGGVNTTLTPEPRLLDVRIAARLGMAHPEEIRQTIEAHLWAFERSGEIFKLRLKSGQDEYWLDEAQAELVCRLSRRPDATEVRREVLKAFRAKRPAAPPPRPKASTPLATWQERAGALMQKSWSRPDRERIAHLEAENEKLIQIMHALATKGGQP